MTVRTYLDGQPEFVAMLLRPVFALILTGFGVLFLGTGVARLAGVDVPGPMPTWGWLLLGAGILVPGLGIASRGFRRTA